MYFIKRKILRWWFRLLGKTPLDMEMVQYWKSKHSVAAAITKGEDGAIIMKMEGEKYPSANFPRGHVLFGMKVGEHGPLPILKHQIKNRIFNESWQMLEEGKSGVEVANRLKSETLDLIFEYLDDLRFELIAPQSMVASVREIYRGWTAVSEGHAQEHRLLKLRDAFCAVLQEDDSYRFRMQWIVEIFNPSSWWFKLLFRDPLRDFDLALAELEQAEIVGDMKARVRLLRRVLMAVLEDSGIRTLFLKFCNEVDWNKVKLTAGDKYHFRGKYFRVDLDKFEY